MTVNGNSYALACCAESALPEGTCFSHLLVLLRMQIDASLRLQMTFPACITSIGTVHGSIHMAVTEPIMSLQQQGSIAF